MDNLSYFYERVYPFKYIWNFLKGDYEREFFLVDNKTEQYKRYHFKNLEEFKKTVIEFKPKTIQIGPRYNINSIKNENYIEEEIITKELIFDIDLPDYNEIRDCCKDNNICKICWNFCKFSIEFIKEILLKEFNYKDIFTFFSGKKGIHIWVKDKEACELPSEDRKFIIERLTNYFNFNYDEIGNDLIDNFFNIALNYFNEQQNKSKKLKEKYDLLLKNKSKRNSILSLYSPRFDKNVTINLKHLIKSPYSLHKDTQLVCIMIDDDDFESMLESSKLF